MEKFTEISIETVGAYFIFMLLACVLSSLIMRTLLGIWIFGTIILGLFLFFMVYDQPENQIAVAVSGLIAIVIVGIIFLLTSQIDAPGPEEHA